MGMPGEDRCISFLILLNLRGRFVYKNLGNFGRNETWALEKDIKDMVPQSHDILMSW